MDFLNLTLAQVLAELHNLPAQLEADVPKIEAEIVSVEGQLQPEVDLAKMLVPQVEEVVAKHVAALEAEIAAEVAKLPPAVAAVVNKYLLPIESGLQF